MNDDIRPDPESSEPDLNNPGDGYYNLPGREQMPEDEIPSGDENKGGRSQEGREDTREEPERESIDLNLDLGRWLAGGWKLISEELIGYIIAAFILAVITVVTLKIFTPIIYLAVAGPLKAGFFLMTVNHLRTGRPPLIGDLFQPFTKYLPVTLAMLIMSVFIAAGLICCLIPGIFLLGIYPFTFLFIVDRGLDFWDAMEASRKVASRGYLEFALFALVLIVLNIAGLLFFLVGSLVTIPLTYASVTIAYKELVGLADEPAVKSSVPDTRPSSPAGAEDPPRPYDPPDIIT